MHLPRSVSRQMALGLILVLVAILLSAGQPPIIAAQPAQPAATPAVPALTFTKTAEPTEVRPGNVVTYTLRLVADTDLTAVIVTDPLPAGVGYVAASATGGGIYDPATATLTWTLSGLSAGQTETLTFQVRVTRQVAGEVLNRAALTAAGYPEPLEAVAGLQVLPPPVEAVITPAQDGALTAADGRVELSFPAGAVDRPVVARFVPQVRARGGFLLTFDLEARGQADGQPVARFEKPVTVTVRYTAEDEAWLRAHSTVAPLSPTLLFFDPAQGEWVPVPGTLDRAARTFTTQLTHFSGYAFGDPAGFQADILPTVKGFQVSLFTGDGTYSLPLYTPPGAGGLAPRPELRYSSGAIADAWLAEQKNGKQTATSQPGWTGQGWALDFGTITRDTDGDPTDNSRHRYVLSMNGVADRLVAIGGEYRLEREPAWKVRWDGGQNAGTWQVWAPDGAQYTFAQRAEYVVWHVGGAACGYSPEHKTYRWYLTQIQDPHGNQVRFTYDEVRESLSYGASCASDYTAAVYLRKIEYGPLNPGQGANSPRVAIDFFRGPRSDYNPSWASGNGGQERYQREKLERIDVTVDGNLVRRYALEYYPTAWPPEGGSPAGTQWLTLQRVRTVGRDGTSELPALTFSYGTAYSNTSTSTVRANLTQVDNGYGGQLRFTYEYFYAGWCHSDPCGHVYRYRAQRRELDNGMSSVQRYGYSYTNPTGNISRQEFWGHQTATETVYQDAWVTAIAQTQTTFHQSDDGTWDPPVRLGRPKEVRELDGSSNELRKTVQTWGWAEVYAGVYAVDLVERNVYQGTARRRTAYLADDYGNGVAERSYGGYGGQTFAVPNAGFEGVADPWGLSPWVAYWGANVDNHENSRRVGRLVMTGGATGGAYQDIGSLTSGKSYEVLAWVRATSGATAKFNLWLHDTQGGNSVQGPAATPGTNWELVRLTYTANSTGAVRIHLHYTAGSGTIYVDNVSLAEVDTDGDARTVHRRFYPNTTTWIVDRAARETVYGDIHPKDDDSGVVARTRYRYDGQSCINVAPSAGKLTAVDRWNGGSGVGSLCASTAFNTTQYGYDGFGNRTSVTDPRGNTTTITYDSGFRAFPIQETNPRNQTTSIQYYGVNGSPATGSGAFFGQVEAVTDPNGSATTTQYQYDVFGRRTKEIRPDDSINNPTVEYSYDDFYAGPTTRLQTYYRETSGCSGCVRPILRFYDGLGRLIQAKAESQDGTQMIVANLTYDAQGLAKEEYVPYFVTSSSTFWEYVTPDTGQPKTTYTYDALGRVTQVTHPDNTTVRTYYSGWQRAVLDEKNHQKIYAADAYGRLVQVKEYTGTYSSPNWGATPYATTSYGYNVLDLLTQVQDAAGNTTSMSYNPLGRKTSMTDPDMGAWSYGYDAAGNLTSQTDARQCSTTFTYDALNRLTGKSYSGTACAATTAVTYTYDQGTYGIGRRTRMDDGSGYTTWTYDARGRLTQETKVINGTGGGTFKTQWSYRADDQVNTMTYPDGEVITTTYNPMGLAKSLAGSATYVQNLDYNARSQPTTMSYGDGTTTAYNYWGEGGRPQLGTFRLWQIKATNGSTLLDVQYDYDLVGNVKWRYDSLSGLGNETLNFTYDDLDRLTGASGAYSENYSYSTIGNLTTKNGVNYLYDAPVSGCSTGTPATKPHAVRQAGSTYGYDCNGNMLQRGSASLVYDEENRLKSYTQGSTTTFVYDADGNRVKRSDTNGTVVYVGDYYELATLYQEDFNDGVADGWTGYAGTWAVQNQAYRQSNTSLSNTNAYRALTQNEPLVYQWTVTYTVGAQAGLYLFASSNTSTERGNAYRVWQDASYVRIYESINNTAYLRASFAAANAAGQTHTYRAIYDSTTGKLQVWRDGTYLGSWTDTSRLSSGAYLSLRTTSTEARFDNLVAYRPVNYYYLAGQRVAMRKGGVVYSLVTDQLGSTSVTRNTSSGQVSAMRYYPWGTTRAGSLPTDYTFTGQKLDASTGLMYYGARYYDPALGRFVQADTIVPEPGNPQDLNRYSYVRNNPVLYRDPSGHAVCVDAECAWIVHPVTGEIKQRSPTNSPPESPQAYSPAESYQEAMGLVNEFRSNAGPLHREFGPTSSLTQDIMYSSGIQEFHQVWAEAGYPSSFEWHHYLDVREGGPYTIRFIKSLPVYIGAQVKLGLAGAGLGSKTPEGPIDAVDGTIGSLDTIRVERVGSGWVRVEVHNTMNWHSGLRIPGGDASLWDTFDSLKVPGTDSTLGDVWTSIVGGSNETDQTFYWWEPMPGSR